MTITARFSSACSACGQPIAVGSQIEWERGNKARHTDCAAAATTSATTSPAPQPADTVRLETDGRRVYVRGDSYPIRGALRGAGCHWDPDAKAWWIGSEKRDALAAAIASATPETATKSRPHYRTCHECGAPSRGYYRCYTCSLDYRDGGDMHAGGMSYRDRHGNFVLGADD